MLEHLFARLANLANDTKNYNFEFLFVNDGSKDKTLDIINKFGTKTNIDLEKDDYCFDHIIPVSKGGSNDLSNLGITTPAANYSKSDLTVEEYLNLCKLVLEHHGYTVNKQ